MTISFHQLKTLCKLDEQGQCPCLVTHDKPRLPLNPDTRYSCAIENVAEKKKRIAKELRSKVAKEQRGKIAKKPLCTGYKH